jgi:hypothetical protein
MGIVQAKILSIDVDCMHCDHNQTVDAAEFGEKCLQAFTEYETECDICENKYKFTLDVIGH